MKKKNFSCRDCVYLQKRNNKFFCVRWSCYTTLKSIKFKEDADLNRLCIPHSRLLENEIKLLKIIYGKPLSGIPENSIQNFQEKIWKYGFNDVTLKQLDNIINDIQNGRIETDTDRRLRQIAEQSSCVQLPRNNNRGMVRNCYKPQRKGNALIAAEICTGSCGRTNRSTSNYFIEGLIERWAKNAGYWIDDISEYAASKSWIRAEKLDGKESMIYTTMSNTIVKVWSMKNYFNNPRLAVEKIILHNFLFGSDTPLKICGFTKINHYLHFVLEQPIIKYQKESYNSLSIERYLKEKFPNRHIDKYNGQFIIHFSDFYVWDLHAGNVVKSKMDGNYYVIDCNIMFKNTTLGSLYNYYNCKVNPLILNSISDLDAIISKANDMIDAFAYTGYYPRSHEEAMIQRYWKDIKKQCNQRKRELKTFFKSPLFTNLIKLLKIRNKTTKKIHTK